MTTVIIIETFSTDKDDLVTSTVTVNDSALKAVLRKFNPTSDGNIDDIKVMCAGLITKMEEVRAANPGMNAKARTASMAISDLEKVQMLCVKSLFAE